MLLPELSWCGLFARSRAVTSCGSALPYLLGDGALLRGEQALWRLCDESALCCALFQQDVQELPRDLFVSSTWETQRLNHSVNHCPFPDRLFLYLEILATCSRAPSPSE